MAIAAVVWAKVSADRLMGKVIHRVDQGLANPFRTRESAFVDRLNALYRQLSSFVVVSTNGEHTVQVWVGNKAN